MKPKIRVAALKIENTGVEFTLQIKTLSGRELSLPLKSKKFAQDCADTLGIQLIDEWKQIQL